MLGYNAKKYKSTKNFYMQNNLLACDGLLELANSLNVTSFYCAFGTLY